MLPKRKCHRCSTRVTWGKAIFRVLGSQFAVQIRLVSALLFCALLCRHHLLARDKAEAIRADTGAVSC